MKQINGQTSEAITISRGVYKVILEPIITFVRQGNTLDQLNLSSNPIEIRDLR
jgi:hypothetical protein